MMSFTQTCFFLGGDLQHESETTRSVCHSLGTDLKVMGLSFCSLLDSATGLRWVKRLAAPNDP